MGSSDIFVSHQDKGVGKMEAQMEGKPCQSCGAPMPLAVEFGTEEDGTSSEKYCKFCYESGAFTAPDMTVDEMIETASRGWSEMDPSVTYEDAKGQLQAMVPELERWKPAA